ncbi:MAG: 3-isopropylmalate dehydratase small subunit [Candidatus Dormibacteria bacterium]
MRPLTVHRGLCARLARDDVDTDQIVPKQFLKRTGRSGYADACFFTWRLATDGSLRGDFELNDSAYAGASILVTGRNFGCGSSREHAVWALLDSGFRVVVASSFADIFRGNALQNGLLPVALSENEVGELMARVGRRDGYQLEVDLERLQVRDHEGRRFTFAVSPFWRDLLLSGQDPIDQAVAESAAIGAYEQARSPLLPTTDIPELTHAH